MQVAESLFLVKQVPSWRSVCVLYSLYCVLILPDAGEAAKARCGRELVADLEFVCGDRGFYRGESPTNFILHFESPVFSKVRVLIVSQSWTNPDMVTYRVPFCGDTVTCMSLNH